MLDLYFCIFNAVFTLQYEVSWRHSPCFTFTQYHPHTLKITNSFANVIPGGLGQSYSKSHFQIWCMLDTHSPLGGAVVLCFTGVFWVTLG